MEVETLTNKTVKSIAETEANTLRFNDEYQRAGVWKTHQKQMFIDSIFRGYSIPAFYFAYKEKATPLGKEDPITRYDVIDGQQRIRAVREFINDGFRLLDPKQSGFKFPNFVEKKPCEWAGKLFSQLDETFKEKFFKQKIVVFEIKTQDSDEIRDLFIRLQGGTPLNAQEKRDAWPGNFTKYILKTAGKKALNTEDGSTGYVGWEFFRNIIASNKESNKRQLAAQLAMTYFHRMDNNTKDFKTIKSVDVDSFYHQNIDFNDQSEEAKNFKRVLDKLAELFNDLGKGIKLKGHDSIHITLLTDLLIKEYSSGWETHLIKKLMEFRTRCRQAEKAEKNNEKYEHNDYYSRYQRWTKTSSDEARTIERRHEFFLGEMIKLLSPYLKEKDKKRAFGSMEREAIYLRDNKQCQWCRMKEKPHTVIWHEMHIHHVIPHAKGGKTLLENGALMHKDCHPRSDPDTANFEKWFFEKKDAAGVEEDDKAERKTIKGKTLKELPDNSKCRFIYKGRTYEGLITKGKISIEGFYSEYNTLSAASRAITGRSSNGWRDWEIYLADKNMWVLADDWRQGFF